MLKELNQILNIFECTMLNIERIEMYKRQLQAINEIALHFW